MSSTTRWALSPDQARMGSQLRRQLLAGGVLPPLRAETAESHPQPAVEDEMPTSLPAFQVLLRLQYLRGQTHRWQVPGALPAPAAQEIPEILAALRGLSVAAQAAGFTGFAGLCTRVAEQFMPMCSEPRVSSRAASLFVTWTHNADRYLRKPSSRTLIAALVSQLGATEWSVPLTARDQDRFIQEMLAPFR